MPTSFFCSKSQTYYQAPKIRFHPINLYLVKNLREPEEISFQENKEVGSQYVHGCVEVEIHPSRMLQVSRICSSLPVFPSEALRTSGCSSARFYPNEWLTVVAGTKLFLWKYVKASSIQPHSPCLSFDLPVSDLPHNASLTGLIFPLGGIDSSSISPTSCVALGSCGGNFRLWPRLTRNYIHVDSVLPAPVGGLYGDEAIQLEPAYMPGTFLVATRTGYLVLIDTRNAENGVISRLINTTHDTRPVSQSQGLLSGLGRRVSNLFNMVTTTSNLISSNKSQPARGGENFVFVRLITCMPNSNQNKSICFMLFENQLDIWILDQNLNHQFGGSYTMENLIDSLSDISTKSCTAVDLVIQNTNYSNQLNAYLLLSSNKSIGQLQLIGLKFYENSNPNEISTICFQIQTSLSVEYPFDNTDNLLNKNDINCVNYLQFLLPSMGGTKNHSIYPCLLACLYCLRTGQVAIIEVLTGQLIGKLQFAPQNPPNQLPCPQSLIGLGNLDSNSLFTYLTCQCGLLNLCPKSNLYQHNMESDQLSSTGSELNVSKSNFSIAQSRNNLSSSIVDTNKRQFETDSYIIVDTVNQGRLNVNINFQTNNLTITLNNNDDNNNNNKSIPKSVKLLPNDHLFVAICEIARVYWMGFKKQSIDYFKILSYNSDLIIYLSKIFLRLSKRILNEHPNTDARWQWIVSNFSTSTTTTTTTLSSLLNNNVELKQLQILEPEGCCGFNFVSTYTQHYQQPLPQVEFHLKNEDQSFVTTFTTTNTNTTNTTTHTTATTTTTTTTPILPNLFMIAKLDALHNLQKLWLLLGEYYFQLHHNKNNNLSFKSDNFKQFIKLIDLFEQINITIKLSTEQELNESNNLKSIPNQIRYLMNEMNFTNTTSTTSSSNGGGSSSSSPDNTTTSVAVHNFPMNESIDELSSNQNLVSNTFPNSKLAFCLIKNCDIFVDPDNLNDDEIIEQCIIRLCRSLDYEIFIKASEDQPLIDNENICYWAESHILTSLHLTGELVQFSSAIQNKLGKEPQSLFQSVFNALAINSGFTSNMLQVIKAQDAVLQTVTLIPQLVVNLCETSIEQLINSYSNESNSFGNTDFNSEISTNNNAVEYFLQVARLLDCGLTNVVRYRNARLSVVFQLSDFLQSDPHCHYLPCWLTDSSPYGIGDVILKFLDHLIFIGSGDYRVKNESSLATSNLPDDYHHQLINEAIKYTVDIIHSLLQIAKQRVCWAMRTSSWAWSQSNLNQRDNLHSSVNEIKGRIQAIQRVRRLKHWYACIREHFITLIGDRLHRPEAALTLAEQFLDRDQLMRWCYLLELQDESHQIHTDDFGIPNLNDEDRDNKELEPRNKYHHHRLVNILKRTPPELKLADYALQWYLSHGERSRVHSLLALLHTNNDLSNSQIVNMEIQSNTEFNMNYPNPIENLFKQSKSDQKKLTNNGMNKKINDPVSEFLHRPDVRDYAWPHLLSTGQYSKAAEILFDEGCKEYQYIGRRKTLFSLAKLAFLANKSELYSQSVETKLKLVGNNVKNELNHPFIEKINAYLDWITLQELIDPNRVKSLGLFQNLSNQDVRLQRLLSIPTLVRLYVSPMNDSPTTSVIIEDNNNTYSESGSHLIKNSQTNKGISTTTTTTTITNGDDDEEDEKEQINLNNFRRALLLTDILDQLGDLRPNNDESHNPCDVHRALLIHIWCQAIKMDEWSTDGEIHDPIEICTRSFVCSLVSDLIRSGVNATEMLPSSNELFNSNELSELVKDPQFCYLIESGFEYMHNLLKPINSVTQ